MIQFSNPVPVEEVPRRVKFDWTDQVADREPAQEEVDVTEVT